MKHPELFESLGIDQPKVIKDSVHEKRFSCLPKFMYVYLCSPEEVGHRF